MRKRLAYVKWAYHTKCVFLEKVRGASLRENSIEQCTFDKNEIYIWNSEHFIYSQNC